MNLEQMSDEELRAFVNSPLEASLQAAQERSAKQEAKPASVDKTQGMSGAELALAGAGRELMQVPRGLRELGVGMFGSKEAIDAYNKEKAETQKIDEDLMSNWEAKAGSFGTQALTAGAAPARIGFQSGLAGVTSALSPLKGPIKDGELPSRAIQGMEGAATTGALGKASQFAGKQIGALTGNFTPQNQAMVEAGRAARRQGIVPTMGAMSPGSGSRGTELGSAWYPEHVAQQAQAFGNRAGQQTQVAGGTLGSTVTREVPGENLRQSITQAGDRMRQQGAQMWESLDNYVRSNNLPAVVARETQQTVQDIVQRYSPTTPRGTPNLRGNEVLSYIQRSDQAGDVVANRISNMLNGRQVATPTFSELHEMQTVVGRALARARYDASAPNAPRSADDASRELSRLYRSISEDVDRWTTTNPTAGRMLDQAKSYWRDTVVPNVINNDLYQKSARGSLGTHNRGYDEPRQFFSDIINKPEEARALYPHMDQRGRDLVTSLHLLPDMGTVVTSAKNQPVSAMGPNGALLSTGPRAPEMFASNLNNTARALALTKPGLVREALGHLPFSRQFATSQRRQERALANDVFRDSPLGRVMWAAMQKPQGDVEEKVREARVGR